MHKLRQTIHFFSLMGALMATVANTAVAADLTISRATPPALVVPDEGTPKAGPNKGLGGGLHSHDLGQHAAELLREYFAKITGAQSEILTETEWIRAGRPPAVVLGHTRRTRARLADRLNPEALPRGGYILHSVPGRLFISGADDRGTYHGASAFLEDFCGVEWLWPTELGEEVPKSEELSVTRLDITFVPAMSFSPSGLTGPDIEWMLRLGSRQWDMEWAGGHKLGVIFDPRWYDTRPEWYPLLDGERLKPSHKYFGWQPVMGAPSARERALSQALKHFHENPESNSFSMGLLDGNWRGGRSRRDLAEDGPAQTIFETTPYHYNPTYSRRWYRFASWVANEIQKTYPGRIISGFAYSGTDLPPANVDPNDHLAINVVGSTWAWLSPAFRRWDVLRLERWSRLVPNLMKHDYMYPQREIPTYAPHFMADVVRTLHRHGLTSHYGEIYAPLTPFGPQLWTHVKMCHDPTQNIDGLLERWMTGMFHEAAEPMQRYYDTLEQAWLNYPYHDRNVSHWGTAAARTLILRPEKLQAMEEALDEAASLATTERVKKRLAVVRAYFIPLKAYSRALWRQRPYLEPVDFEDTVVIQDLKDHAAGTPIFDNNAHYKEYLENEPLFFQGRWTGTAPYDTPAQRLGRVVDGILAEPLAKHAERQSFDPEPARKAVRERMDRLASKAGVSDAVKATLADMAARAVFIPKVKKGPGQQIDEAFWSAFPEHTDFVKIPPDTPGEMAPVNNATSFRIVHDGRQFHLFIDCRQDPASISAKADTRVTPRMREMRQLPEAVISKDDRIQLTLAPWRFWHQTRSHARADIAVNANGLVEESAAGYGAFYWKTDTTAIARRTADGYQLQVSIPFHAASYTPEDGALVHFNIRRFVTGDEAETTAWYPATVGTRRDVMDGNVFAVVQPSAPDLMLNDFGQTNTRPVTNRTCSMPMTANAWRDYVIHAPAEVAWPRGSNSPVSVSGKRMLLLATEHERVQPGHDYELRVTCSGEGECSPSLRWYRRVGPTLVDAAATASNEVERLPDNKSGVRTVVVRLTAPAEAEAARPALECTGNVDISAVEMTPVLPVDVRVDLDLAGDELVCGQMLGLQATVRNISNKPLEGLRVRLAHPAGIDRVAQQVTAAETVEPNAETAALWSLVPIYYDRGACDFVLVIEADTMPPLVTRVRGPLPGRTADTSAQ
ncbi:MAG: DUF4838 domain-containing protein [Candidatus Pacebacteria bacterium]|nr:DUF4838 domain-containing protein [Candidatus Paceibacterota bacterium]